MTITPAIDWLKVQKRLSQLGFNPGPIDGLPGLRTNQAVIAFKKSVGLRARAYIGPRTLEALFETSVKSKRGGVKPKAGWMVHAESVKGIHERRNYSKLKLWMSAAGSYDWRDVPWCGAYVATVMKMYDASIELDFNTLGARNWLNFGVKCKPQYGAVMVFYRGKRNGWQGHVGLYVGEDKTHYHILGGNQSNAVTVARIKKSRFLGARMPKGYKGTGNRIIASGEGLTVTTNEA